MWLRMDGYAFQRNRNIGRQLELSRFFGIVIQMHFDDHPPRPLVAARPPANPSNAPMDAFTIQSAISCNVACGGFSPSAPDCVESQTKIPIPVVAIQISVRTDQTARAPRLFTTAVKQQMWLVTHERQSEPGQYTQHSYYRTQDPNNHDRQPNDLCHGVHLVNSSLKYREYRKSFIAMLHRTLARKPNADTVFRFAVPGVHRHRRPVPVNTIVMLGAAAGSRMESVGGLLDALL